MLAKILVNFITILRIPLIFLAIFFVIKHIYYLAAIFYFLAFLSDWIDGFLARLWKAETEFGRNFLEPFCDGFIFYGGLIICLLLFWGVSHLLFYSLLFTILVLAMLVRLIRHRIKSVKTQLFIQVLFYEIIAFIIFLELLFMVDARLLFLGILFIPIIIYLKRKRIKNFLAWVMEK